MNKQTSAKSGLSSANWTNLLPPFEEKSIVKYGTKKLDNIKTFLRGNCKSLICIGPRRSDFIDDSISYHQNTEHLEEKKYDFFLIDEIDFFSDTKTLTELQEKFKKIFNLLNSKGVMLVALPRSLHFIKYRFAVNKIAHNAGFESIDTLLCEPSFDEPLIVYPFSQDQCFTLKMLLKHYFDGRGLKILLTGTIKYLLLKINPLFSPFLGVAFIARKSPETGEELNAERLSRYYKEPIIADKLYSLWFDKYYSRRQIGFLYYGDIHKKQLLAVSKQSDAEDRRSSPTLQEYDKLVLLSEHSAAFKAGGIVIPKPICFEIQSGKNIFIQSALLGHTLEEYRKNFSSAKTDLNYLHVIDRLVDVQIFIQDLLTNDMKHRLPKISAKYFENATHFQYEALNNIERIDFYNAYVQHGDFTDINIIYNDLENTWGIIDWEWLAAGFPPLFDIFYLLTSLGHRDNITNKNMSLEQIYNSFIQTFYKKNSYSNFVKNAILRYCEHFNLDNRKAFDYLLDFLLFHYNKYRMGRNASEYIELYKNMLQFSIKNKERYIVW